MLILIKIHIVVKVLDLIHVHNFHYLAVASAKMELFSELIIVLLCMLIIIKKNILLSEGPTQGLDNTIIEEDKHPFTISGKTFVLSLYYNGSNNFLFVNATKIYQFKAKDSEIKPHPLFLGNNSTKFTLDNIKSRVKRKCKSFFC